LSRTRTASRRVAEDEDEDKEEDEEEEEEGEDFLLPNSLHCAASNFNPSAVFTPW
jgi:hypothetical protein